MDNILAALNLPKGSWSLHIGAGELEEMETYKRLCIKPVWVEARPQAVTDAKCTWPFQRIIQACVAEESGKIVKFCEAQNGALSGLRVDENKVKLRGYRHMKTISLLDLLSANKYAQDRFTLLVINTNGTELEIIRSVPVDMWDALEAIVVHFEDEQQRKFIEQVLDCLFSDQYVVGSFVIGQK